MKETTRNQGRAASELRGSARCRNLRGGAACLDEQCIRMIGTFITNKIKNSGGVERLHDYRDVVVENVRASKEKCT